LCSTQGKETTVLLFYAGVGAKSGLVVSRSGIVGLFWLTKIHLTLDCKGIIFFSLAEYIVIPVRK
jgi:hypothetical protein